MSGRGQGRLPLAGAADRLGQLSDDGSEVRDSLVTPDGFPQARAAAPGFVPVPLPPHVKLKSPVAKQALAARPSRVAAGLVFGFTTVATAGVVLGAPRAIQAVMAPRVTPVRIARTAGVPAAAVSQPTPLPLETAPVLFGPAPPEAVRPAPVADAPLAPEPSHPAPPEPSPTVLALAPPAAEAVAPPPALESDLRGPAAPQAADTGRSVAEPAAGPPVTLQAAAPTVPDLPVEAPPVIADAVPPRIVVASPAPATVAPAATPEVVASPASGPAVASEEPPPSPPVTLPGLNPPTLSPPEAPSAIAVVDPPVAARPEPAETRPPSIPAEEPRPAVVAVFPAEPHIAPPVAPNAVTPPDGGLPPAANPAVASASIGTPPAAPPVQGLLLVARQGDTLQRLYRSVYNGVRPPPFQEVADANPTPVRPGVVLVFPTPPGGWRHQ